MTVVAPPPARGDAERLTRENLGFLLAKASQRWNDLLGHRFAAAGYPEVRPAYGSLLIPLFEEDGLRQGELARRARSIVKSSHRDFPKSPNRTVTICRPFHGINSSHYYPPPFGLSRYDPRFQ